MANQAATLRSLSIPLYGLMAFAGALIVPAPAAAQVAVTETFGVGSGTRFDTFVNNDVVRPKPATMDNPSDNEVVQDGFGGQRTLVENGNIVTNHFGLTTSNFAGGTGAGEFGGEFNWFDYGGVADTNLGGELNHSQEVVIKGKMLIKDLGYENDERITLGYYNLPPSPTATDFNRGNISAGIGFVGGPRFVLQINGNNSGAINVPYDTSFDIDLTLKFDANVGEAWFEGNVNGIEIGQFTFSRPADALHPFNAFAISQSYLREQQDAWRRGIAFIDDVTYSVVSDQGADNLDPVRIDDNGSPGLAGDFDGDGSVDGDDLTLWNGGFGTLTGAMPVDGDADDDGDVDGGDFLTWQSQFGVAGAVGAIGAVPEPNSLCLGACAAALGVWASVTRRRSR
ncbi:MAG: hypothetical protein IT424_13675 [Pirellulales bacterium]|nr:hypothetical protein [Pirellulales bacterium]